MSDVRVAAVDPAVERLTKSRERDAVLKLRIAQIRGGNRDIAIFAFEGADDKIVFSRWIERARPGLVYEPFVGDGKRTIRALKAVLPRDLGNLADNVFFFVDRDYDDLSGFHDEDNVFMTETYSIENYLVSRDLIESILRDEFPCHESPAVRTTIATAFAASYEQFLRASSATNLRLFIARRIGIECAPIRVKAGQLADIEIDHSTDKGADPSELIMLVREPTEEEAEALKPEFADLDSEQRYRGKFAWSFFKTWLNKLHQDYTKGGAWFPGVDRTTKAKISEITFGSLASKSALPLGLDAFLAAVH